MPGPRAGMAGPSHTPEIRLVRKVPFFGCFTTTIGQCTEFMYAKVAQLFLPAPIAVPQFVGRTSAATYPQPLKEMLLSSSTISFTSLHRNFLKKYCSATAFVQFRNCADENRLRKCDCKPSKADFSTFATLSGRMWRTAAYNLAKNMKH